MKPSFSSGLRLTLFDISMKKCFFCYGIAGFAEVFLQEEFERVAFWASEFVRSSRWIKVFFS